MIKLDSEIEIHPLVARRWVDYAEDIPHKYIEDNIRKFGEITKISTQNPVSNLHWSLYFFKDSSAFSPAANAFKLSEQECKGTVNKPKYTPHLKGTKQYINFWTEERRRCLHGYEPEVNDKPCGIVITGEHYFYLNYCRINQTGIDEETGEEIELSDFPRFLSMDYYWFTELEARENPRKYDLLRSYKKSLIVAKARRMGFSYKNAAGAVWKYTFFANIKVAIISEVGDKSIETFEKCLTNIDWLNEYTEFGGPHIYRTFNRTQHKGAIKAGVKTKDGQERGRKSEIYTISLHNRPDAASGAGCVRVIFEEAGMIGRLEEAWEFTERTLKSGAIYKGIAIIFGTGGEMSTSKGKAGSSMAFAKMFNDPETYKLASFDNIYEFHESNKKCGLFFNICWLREGSEFELPTGEKIEGLDTKGNVNAWVGEIDLNMNRMKEKRKSKIAYEISITQECKTPEEAFLLTDGNVFPSVEIEEQINHLLSSDILRYTSTHGTLAEVQGKIEFKPDLNNKLRPLDRFPNPSDINNTESAVVIYEQPKTINGKIPNGAYIVNVEPIGVDSTGGQSLIAIYVVKTPLYPIEIGHDEVVAHYVGRPVHDQLNKQNELALKLARYYNAMVTHENDRSGSSIRNYFLENKEYSRLMKPPADIVSKTMPNSRTLLRKTGYSMSSDDMKELGELYLLRFLMKVRYSDDEVTIRNLNLIKDIALLQELKMYNRDGNFDRVMCIMGIAINLAQLETKKHITIVENLNAAEEFFKQSHEAQQKKREYSMTDITDSRYKNLIF
jgi:hypothetical protein